MWQKLLAAKCTSDPNLEPRESALTPLIALTSYLLISWLVLLIHEFGHAVAGDLAGMRIFEIRIGTGPRIFRFRLSGISIEFNLLPYGGIVRAFPPITGRRYQMIIFTAGGLTANILFLIGFTIIADRVASSWLANAILLPAFLSQVVVIILNLWPRQVYLYGRRMENDGLSILRMLRSKEPFGAADKSQYVATIMSYVPSGAAPPLLTAQSDRLAYHLSCRSQSDGIFQDQTILALDEELSRDGTQPAEEMMALDALVTNLLGRDFSRYCSEMDRWSKRALELNPASATLRGSRGSVLAELGRHDEALAMLADAENGEDGNDCLVNAYRALAYFHRGDKERASNAFSLSLSRYNAMDWAGWSVPRIVSRIGSEIGEIVPSGNAAAHRAAA